MCHTLHLNLPQPLPFPPILSSPSTTTPVTFAPSARTPTPIHSPPSPVMDGAGLLLSFPAWIWRSPPRRFLLDLRDELDLPFLLPAWSAALLFPRAGGAGAPHCVSRRPSCTSSGQPQQLRPPSLRLAWPAGRHSSTVAPRILRLPLLQAR
jgi:hypothetical protein